MTIHLSSTTLTPTASNHMTADKVGGRSTGAECNKQALRLERGGRAVEKQAEGPKSRNLSLDHKATNKQTPPRFRGLACRSYCFPINFSEIKGHLHFQVKGPIHSRPTALSSASQ